MQMEERLTSNRLNNSYLYGALLVAWVATMGSLYFSEVRHFLPCALCWYQRILMYPLALLILVGILRQDRHLPYLILPFSVAGQGLATYHYLLEKTTLFGAPAACATGVSCLTPWINWFGFVTIPFLSMVAFMLITLFAVLALYYQQPVEGTRIQWQPVLIIVGTVLITYIVLAQSQPAIAQQEDPPFIVRTLAENPEAFSPVEPEVVNAALIEGARLYQQACAACHGPQAEGVANLGTNLVTSEFMANHDDEAVLAMIRAGRMSNDPDNITGLVMPANGGRPDLTDQDMLVIIGFLRNRSMEVQ
jgi:disulfide bond formation protein DsbB/mono/diheme cytochrome c family protein